MGLAFTKIWQRLRLAKFISWLFPTTLGISGPPGKNIWEVNMGDHSWVTMTPFCQLVFAGYSVVLLKSVQILLQFFLDMFDFDVSYLV